MLHTNDKLKIVLVEEKNKNKYNKLITRRIIMDKKKNFAILLATILVVLIGALTFYFEVSKKETKKEEPTPTVDQTDEPKESSTILIVYYSAQSHTEAVVNTLKETLQADVFKVEPKNPYTTEDLNYLNSESRVVKEHNDETLQDVELVTTTIDLSQYDTILIGYPIWWGVAAWPINNFVKNNDFTGKTVIPFCTSASTGIEESVTTLKSLNSTGSWLEGKRFSSGASSSEINEWIENLINLK